MTAVASYPRTMAELLALTEAQPDDAFFQEHSRKRELDYIEKSYTRWMEILELVRERLPNTRELSCLDIGTSPFTFLLPGHFKKVSGLDLTAAFRPRCEAVGVTLYEGGVTVDKAVAQVEPVDCILFLEVIEHLHVNPVKVLGRLRSALRKGGLLVVSTPNMMCFANRIRMLLNRKLSGLDYPPFTNDDEAHGFGHDRIYMPAELREYMQACGFQDVEIAYQLHYGEAPGRRLIPQLVKRVIPSTRDGMVGFGVNP
jgi:SAM-dependent methyltransferase